MQQLRAVPLKEKLIVGNEVRRVRCSLRRELSAPGGESGNFEEGGVFLKRAAALKESAILLASQVCLDRAKWSHLQECAPPSDIGP